MLIVFYKSQSKPADFISTRRKRSHAKKVNKSITAMQQETHEGIEKKKKKKAQKTK
ncbi:hypothetical protein SK128_004746, partial [Halocaridina rubra]